MIRAGFLDATTREELVALVRDGKAETRLTRRANALLLLDDGMSCEAVAKVLYLDDDTIRYWYKLYREKGLKWLAEFGYKGRICELTASQQEELKNWVTQTLPRTTTMVGEWIEKSYGISYTRSALIKLLNRMGMEYRKPKLIPSKLDPEKQKGFIEGYENLLNNLGDDESVVFGDAVHPTHEVRPAGCWAPKDKKIVIEQTSGRQRLNIHGAIDLETGKTRMIEVLTVDAVSTIALLMAIALMYPTKKLIHVFLDNARYHHAVMVQQWLAQPGCRIKVHYIPTYCPHLDPIERLWGLMHRNVTHNRSYPDLQRLL
jgi:transposase